MEHGTGRRRHGLAEALVVALLLVGPLSVRVAAEDVAPAEPPEEPPLVVSVERDRLSLRAEVVSLPRVLEEVGRRTGVDVSMDVPLEEDVTLSFRNLPFGEAFAKLLGGRGFVLVYAAARRGEPATLRSVKVMAPPALTTPDAPAERAAPSPTGIEVLADLEPLPFDLLSRLALQDREPSIRMRALEILGDRASGDRRLRPLLLTAAREDPDDDVRAAAVSLLDSVATTP